MEYPTASNCTSRMNFLSAKIWDGEVFIAAKVNRRSIEEMRAAAALREMRGNEVSTALLAHDTSHSYTFCTRTGGKIEKFDDFPAGMRNVVIDRASAYGEILGASFNGSARGEYTRLTHTSVRNKWNYIFFEHQQHTPPSIIFSLPSCVAVANGCLMNEGSGSVPVLSGIDNLH